MASYEPPIIVYTLFIFLHIFVLKPTIPSNFKQRIYLITCLFFLLFSYGSLDYSCMFYMHKMPINLCYWSWLIKKTNIKKKNGRIRKDFGLCSDAIGVNLLRNVAL